MPVKGIICRKDGTQKTFAECLECKEKACLPFAYRYLIAKHNTHRDGVGLSASMLSGCPLQLFLLKNNDVYLDYTSLHFTAIRGSLVHQALENEPVKEGVIKEKRFSRTIDGTELSGMMDRIEITAEDEHGTQDCIVEDYKTTKMIIPSKCPDKKHSLQLAIYKWILEGNGFIVKKGILHYIDFGDCLSVEAEKITTEEIEKFIKERVALFTPVIKENKEPLGEPSYLCDCKNKMKKSYCPVRHLCKLWGR